MIHLKTSVAPVQQMLPVFRYLPDIHIWITTFCVLFFQVRMVFHEKKKQKQKPSSVYNSVILNAFPGDNHYVRLTCLHILFCHTEY